MKKTPPVRITKQIPVRVLKATQANLDKLKIPAEIRAILY